MNFVFAALGSNDLFSDSLAPSLMLSLDLEPLIELSQSFEVVAPRNIYSIF